MIDDKWFDNEHNLCRLLYNKATLKEKISLLNWAISDTNDSLINTKVKWYERIGYYGLGVFLLIVILPFIIKFEKFIDDEWCEESGFFCDDNNEDCKVKRCKLKHYKKGIKNRVNVAWENLSQKKILEAL